MPSVLSDQLQGELCTPDVAVRQQKQVPDATGQRQQAERSQGAPQLSAAADWRRVLMGRNRAEQESSNTPHLDTFYWFVSVPLDV